MTVLEKITNLEFNFLQLGTLLKNISISIIIFLLPGMLILSFLNGCHTKSYNSCRLQVSANGHYLLQDGKPFFYLGDTAWFLFAAVDSCGIRDYLEDRKTKGFNVIQLHVTPHYYDDKNIWGERPYIDNNPAQYNDKYWNYSKWVVEQAQKQGFYCAIMVGHALRVGDRNEPPYAIPRENHPTAYQNGWLIGNWFRDLNEKIIWVGSWDCNPEKLNIIENIRAQMEGIADAINGVNTFDHKADYSTTLMTAHPNGTHSSSEWFHSDNWLDFNWIQSYGHLDIVTNKVTTDYNKFPTKPTLLCEGAYEATARGNYNMEINRYRHKVNGEWRWYSEEYGEILPWHIRYQAYQSVFTGACGVGYGHRGLIQTLNDSGSRQSAYNATGGKQLQYIVKLFNSFDFTKLIPDQSLLIKGNEDSETTSIWSIRAQDSSFVFIY
jgi:hypothetical protein